MGLDVVRSIRNINGRRNCIAVVIFAEGGEDGMICDGAIEEIDGGAWGYAGYTDEEGG